MPNQLLPLEKTSGNIHSKLPANNNTHTDENPGGCTAQMLLTTDFSSIPNDVSSYINLIGPARIILRDCVRTKAIGCVIVRNGVQSAVPSIAAHWQMLTTTIAGDRENIEVVLYGAGSVYSKIQILRFSQDPEAKSIAEQELLESIGVVPNPYDYPTQVGPPFLANSTLNNTIAPALENVNPVRSVLVASS